MSENKIELLLIEDNPGDARLIQESLQETLSSRTFNLVWVDQLVKGIEHLMHNPVDAVLLDLSLPDSSGIDTFLKFHAQAAHVPIVLMTGLDDEELASKAVREGAQDYLVKGQTDTQLLERAIRYAIERKQAEEALKKSEWKFRSLVEQSSEGIAIADEQGRIIDWNHAQEQISGLKQTEVIGHPLWEVQFQMLPDEIKNPAVKEQFEEKILHLMTSSAPQQTSPLETIIQLPDGKQRIIENVVFQFITDKGFMAGSISRDVTIRKQAEDEIHRRLADLQVLYESSLALSNSSSPQEIGQKIIEILKENLNWHYAIVRLKKEESDELDVIGFAAPDIKQEDYATEMCRLNNLVQNIDQGISGWVIQNGQTVHNGDPHSDARYIESFADIRSGLYVPMKTGNQVIGVICVESQIANAFDIHNERMLETLSKIAADAILRSRLRHQTERQLHRLKALRSIDMAISSIFDLRLILETVLDHIFAQLNVDAADFLLFNPLTQILEYKAGRGFRSRELSFSERLGEGLAGRAVLERRTVSEIGDGMLGNIPHNRLQQIAQEEFVSHIAVPLITKGEIKGVLEIFHRTPLNADAEWLNFLETLAGQAVIAIDNATLFENVQRSNFELTMAYDATLEGWSKALDLRDKITESHTRRMVDVTLQLAQKLGINEVEQLHIRRGVLLHDIGKMGVPDAILHKSGPLTEEEWKIMRQHPQFAFDMLSPIQYLRPALDIPYCHHEKWDGTGYPRGLLGEQIPLVARLFAVVDVYDALTSDRPYRKTWSKEKALAHIQSQSGKHFDARMVEAFLKLFQPEM